MKSFVLTAIVCSFSFAACLPLGESGKDGSNGKDGAPGARGLPGKDGISPVVSGARLRAIYRTGVDGSSAPVSWYDTDLGIECEFGAAEDAVLRCLPSVGTTTQVDMYYTKSTCDGVAVAANVFHNPGSCTTDPAYVIWSPEGCPKVRAVYRVDGKFTSTMPSYRSALPEGECSNAVQDSVHLLAVTHIDPGQFMSAVDIHPY